MEAARDQALERANSHDFAANSTNEDVWMTPEDRAFHADAVRSDRMTAASLDREIERLKQQPASTVPPPPERIDKAATRVHNDIYPGVNHLESVEAAAKSRGMTVDELIDKHTDEEAEHGFLTNSGRFVNREEALKIAESRNQIDPENAWLNEPDAIWKQKGLNAEALKKEPASTVPPPPADWTPVSEEPESIRSAAIRHEGNIYEGRLHSDAYQTAADATGKDFGDVIGKTKPEDAGFMSTAGRYMSRDEAADLIGHKGKSELAAEQLPEEYYNPSEWKKEPAPPPSTVGVIHETPESQGAARAIKQIFSPDTVSPVAEGAAADIREAGGRAARDTETTRASLDAQSKTVSALPEPEKLNLIDYIENRSKPDEYMGVNGPIKGKDLEQLLARNKTMLANFEAIRNGPHYDPTLPQYQFLDPNIKGLKEGIAKQEAALKGKASVSP